MSLRDQNQALLKKPRCQKPLRPWPFQPLSVSLLPLSIISPMPFCRPYRQSVYDCRRISGFPVFAITVALSNLFGVGGGSLMSRCLGEGDEKVPVR